jgi:hypothetical protein
MLLPEPSRRGEIKFSIAKSLPYNGRLVIIAALLLAGLSVQAIGYGQDWSLFAGAPLLLAATMLSIVKGFSNVPEHLQGTPEWRGAERAQLENIIKLDRKSRDWDQSVLDVTCASGAMVLLAAAGVVVVVAFGLYASGQDWAARAWVVDACLLLAPHWFTGIRHILKNAPLTVKASLLLTIIDFWEKSRQDDEMMLPQMEVLAGPKGDLPRDAKLVLRFSRLPDTFLGLQVQIAINRVEGADYPYLYCVLVARPEMEMLSKVESKEPPPPRLIVERERKPADSVDILVIRQDAKAGSRGFHTPPPAAQSIFAYALDLARKLKSS